MIVDVGVVTHSDGLMTLRPPIVRMMVAADAIVF